MKILIYGINYSPELTGVGKYTGEMAQWLAAAGHEVKVITAVPYYPEWKVAEGFSNRRYSREVVDGVTVLRSPLFIPSRPGGIPRVLHLLSFAFCSAPLVVRQVRWRPDLVWIPQPTLFCAPAGLLLSRLAKARTWLHIQDFEVNAGFGLGLLSGAWIRHPVLGFETWIMRRFSKISAISDSMAALARDKGAPGNVQVFPNWVDADAIRPLDEVSEYRAELGIDPRATVLLYSGNMGAKQGLAVLADAARSFSEHPDVQFVFCGNGSYRGEMEQRCAGLLNVRFLDLQPIERLNQLLGLADIHLLPQRAGVSDLVLPSKLTGILASGRPLIAGVVPGSALSRWVEGCGIEVEPENADSLIEAIDCLVRDSRAREVFGKAARKRALELLSKSAILGAFERSVVRLVGHSGADEDTASFPRERRSSEESLPSPAKD